MSQDNNNVSIDTAVDEDSYTNPTYVSDDNLLSLKNLISTGFNLLIHIKRLKKQRQRALITTTTTTATIATIKLEQPQQQQQQSSSNIDEPRQ